MEKKVFFKQYEKYVTYSLIKDEEMAKAEIWFSFEKDAYLKECDDGGQDVIYGAGFLKREVISNN